jgi:hypothetical protein
MIAAQPVSRPSEITAIVRIFCLANLSPLLEQFKPNVNVQFATGNDSCHLIVKIDHIVCGGKTDLHISNFPASGTPQNLTAEH